MSITETQTPPPEVERITVVLRAKEGSTLNQVKQFAGTGLIVAIGRGLGVLEAHCQGDAIQIAHQATMRLGEAIESHAYEIDLHKAALSTPAHLAAHAQEMFDLLVRINTKCGGLDAALGHGIEPSEKMWAESREAMEAIWDLLDKVKADGVFGPEASMHIDDRVRMAANARRYEWLRDVAFNTPRQDLVPRDKSGNMLIEQDLEAEIDRAMKAYPGEQEAEPCAD